MSKQRGPRPHFGPLVRAVAGATLVFLAGCGENATGPGSGANAPVVNGVQPPNGSPAGGTFVTLSGSGFLFDVVGSTTVTFAGLEANDVVVIDDTLISLTTPAHTEEAFVDVEVTNSRGTGSLSGGFQYLATASIVSDLNSDGVPDLAVGATEDPIGGLAAGAIYVFYGTEASMGTGDEMASDADVVVCGLVDGDRFGETVQVGDVNADGHADLLVGAPRADGPALDSGTVSIFLGPLPAAGVLSTADADITLTGEGSIDPYYGVDGDEFGAALSLGDVNGDAVLDIVVGAPGVDTDPGLSSHLKDTGRAYLFLGGSHLASGSALDADLTISGVREKDQFGTQVCLVNLTGDEHADIAVAYDLNVSGTTHTERVAIFAQGIGASLTSDDADFVLSGVDNIARFGSTMTRGDFNMDGYGDLAVGAPFNSQNGLMNGRVFLFMGSADFASRNSDEADVIYSGGGWSGVRLGTKLAAADVNGDGADDLMMGSPFSSSGAIENGQIFVAFGQQVLVDLQVQNCDVILTGEESDGERFGSALEVLDTDMDGVADILSSATGHSELKGRVYVFQGEESLLDLDAAQGDLTLTGESEGVGFGSSISRGK
jgi:hypothetical protein